MRDFGDSETSAIELISQDEVIKKVNRRLLPLFFCMVVLCFLDRSNLAYAALQMNSDLGFGPEVYGLGSGLFFITYASIQVPSNLILRSIGGPVWLAVIIALWGTIAASFALITNKTQFYVLRTLLGLAESGAFPGMWYLLNKFYPPDHITTAFAVVECGIPLAHTIAGPIAAGLLSMHGLLGLRGWQWLFLLEGLPCLALSAAILYLLPASPETATFLTTAQKKYLITATARSVAMSIPVAPDDSYHTLPVSIRAGTEAEVLLPDSASVAGVVRPDELHQRREPPDSDSDDADDDGERQRLLMQDDVCEEVPNNCSDFLKITDNGAPDLDTRAATPPCQTAPSNTERMSLLRSSDMSADLRRVSNNCNEPLIEHRFSTAASSALEITQGNSPVTDRSARSSASRLVLLGRIHSESADVRSKDRKCLWSEWCQVLCSEQSQISLRAAFSSKVVWYFGAAKFLKDIAGYGVLFFAPLIVHSLTDKNSSQRDPSTSRSAHPKAPPGDDSQPSGVIPALLTSIPFGLAAASTLIIAHTSRVTRERVLHTSLPPIIGGLVFMTFAWMLQHSVVMAFMTLLIGILGVMSASAPGLSLLSDMTAGPGLVVALPLYNSIGNVGGFLGPYLNGVLLSRTGNFTAATLVMGACLTLGGCMMISIPWALRNPYSRTRPGL